MYGSRRLTLRQQRYRSAAGTRPDSPARARNRPYN